MSKFAGKMAPCTGAKIAPGDAGHARADRERQQLQPVDGHRHQLGRELVLAKRPPGAAGARLVHEVQDRDDEHERDEGDVEVAVERRDLPPEELERVEVRDPVRAARDQDALRSTTSQICRKKSVTIAR